MKYVFVLIFIVLCAGMASFFSFSPAYADTNAQKNVRDELNEEIDKSLSELITEELEAYFEDLKQSSDYDFGSTLKDFVVSVISGRSPLTADAVLELIGNAVRNNILSVLSSLAAIIALSILYGVLRHMNSGFMRESTSQIVYFAVYGAIVATLAAIVGNAVAITRNVLVSVSGLVDAAMPVFLTLITALGGTSGMSVYQPVTMIVSSVIIKIIEYAVMPLFFSAVVFGMIGNLSGNVKLDKLTKTFRSIANWLLGVMFSVVGALLSVQGIVGASIDNVSIRSAKFALSSYVPILGGYLSDGFDIVLAAGVLIKNAFGLAGILMLAAVILGPVLKILVISLCLRLAAGIIEPVTDEKISGLLYATGKSLTVLVTIILGLFFLIFVIFMLMITSCNAGVN
jgi:stage III sporulation protein AE